MVRSGMQRNWTREEHLAAFGLYTRLPFGQLHQRNPEIVQLAADDIYHHTGGRSVAFAVSVSVSHA